MPKLDGINFQNNNTNIHNNSSGIQGEIDAIKDELTKQFKIPPTQENVNDPEHPSIHFNITRFSDKFVTDIIQNDPLLKESSKETTLNKMLAAKRFVEAENLHDLMVNPTRYGQHIVESELKLNTKKNHLVGILTLLKNTGAKRDQPKLYSKWYKYFLAVNQVIRTRIGANIPTEKQAENSVEWETILQVRDRLRFGSYDHLLMSIYTMVPPRRQWDYMQMPIYLDPDYTPKLDHNHFHVKSNKYNSPYMFIIDCKNAQYFNPFFNKEIPKSLVKTLLISIKENPRSYVFTQTNGKGPPFDNANSFQKFSNRAFKRIFENDPEFNGNSTGMSVNVFRHSFATYMDQKNDLPIATKKRLAKKMGHSYNMNMEYVQHKQK